MSDYRGDNGGQADEIAEAPGLSVVLPAYNEESLIYNTIAETAAALDDLPGCHEIIVVNDGSVDGTEEALRRVVSNLEITNIKIINLEENQGKGNALRRGFYESSKEYICFLDADLDLHPSQIGQLLALASRRRSDIVIGSKRHPESKIDYPWYRKLFSNVYYLLVLTLFRLPVKDTQTGIKLFRRRALELSFPRIVIKAFAFDLELLVVANHLGFSVSEAPITLTFHQRFGRIKWTDIRNILIDTLAVFYRLHILRYYDSPLKPVTDHEPKVSIIVPTRGMDSMLEECLRRCRALDYSNFDIKVIPDVHIGECGDLKGQVIPSGPVGPSVKRNYGIDASDAEIVGFIDADAWPDPEWLKNAAPYFEDEEVAAVCGPAITPPDDSRRQQASGAIYSSTMVSGKTTFRYTHHTYREVDDYPSCNLLVRRTDAIEAGAFPEEFWPGEDTVLCLNLSQTIKKKILYVPNVVVFHHRRAVYLPHLKQVYSYAMHRGYFVKKFPATSRRLQFFVPSAFVLFLLLGLALSFVATPIMYSYLAILGIYLVTVFLSSIKSLDPLIDLMVIPGIIATNLTYGVGFMRGLFSKKRWEH